MKKLILAGLFGISNLFVANADAATFNFTYFGSHGGGYTMVACDYAEYQVEELFRLFGATNVRANCSGGILPNGMVTPLSLRVNYTPVKMTEKMETVQEHFRSDSRNVACDFNSDLVRRAVRAVKNVKIVRANDFCYGGSRSFDFTFSVKLPM